MGLLINTGEFLLTKTLLCQLAGTLDDSLTDAMAQCIFEICFLDEEGNGQSESEERLPDLPLLSEQLLLDELWDMLGECLKELEESHDQHAVLGRLIPSVEMHLSVL